VAADVLALTGGESVFISPRTRRERLQSLGFDSDAARMLSAFHTKNFM